MKPWKQIIWYCSLLKFISIYDFHTALCGQTKSVNKQSLQCTDLEPDYFWLLRKLLNPADALSGQSYMCYFLGFPACILFISTHNYNFNKLFYLLVCLTHLGFHIKFCRTPCMNIVSMKFLLT